MCINVAGCDSENEFILMPPPPTSTTSTADSELGQVLRLLSGWYCSTLFFVRYFISFSFKLFANVSLSYRSPKTHNKAASPAPGAQRSDFKKRITVTVAGKNVCFFLGISENFSHYCEYYFAATKTGSLAGKALL